MKKHIYKLLHASCLLFIGSKAHNLVINAIGAAPYPSTILKLNTYSAILSPIAKGC